jgi:hypothetical protein
VDPVADEESDGNEDDSGECHPVVMGKLQLLQLLEAKPGGQEIK